jgi:hypothetical protein
MNRVKWMNERGRDLYGRWTTELLQASDTPAFWQAYRDSLANTYQGITTAGVVLGPDDIVKRLTAESNGALTEVDKRYNLGRDILLPHKDEILRFTGAADRITRNNITPEEAVLMHPRDSLRFGVGFSAGVVNDVFLQHTFSAYTAFRYKSRVLDTGSAAERQAVYQEIAAHAGEWWDPSLEPASFKPDWLQVSGLLSLHKLSFAVRSLANTSLTAQLEYMTTGGFESIGDEAATPERLSPTAKVPVKEGWRIRALRLGVKQPEGAQGPYSVLDYTKQTDVFTCRPEALDYLRRTRREQNRHGLPEKSIPTAGNLPQLEPSRPFTLGCPVARMGILAMTNNFTRKAYETSLQMHQEFWR